jgi:predicted nucleotidyltransferase
MTKINPNEAVAVHHKLVEEHYPDYTVILTSLVGSQNYGLDTENSDIDTCSFVLPSFENFIYGKAPVSAEFDCDDGKCTVKDLRIAFNLLRKPSPNSVEWFLSDYKYFNPNYENFLYDIFNNEKAVYALTHANFKNMIDAVGGTAKGLHGRNMSSGKKVSHVIRLQHFIKKYLTTQEVFNYLKLTGVYKDAALYAKTTTNNWEDIYQLFLNELIDYLKMWDTYNSFTKTEEICQDFINKVELKLFEIYLRENGYERKD